MEEPPDEIRDSGDYDWTQNAIKDIFYPVTEEE